MEVRAEEKMEFYCGLFNRLYETVSRVYPEHAVEVSLAIFQEIAKDLRTERIAEWRIGRKLAKSGEEGGGEFATTRQREALHKFGIKQIPRDLSKEEASEALNLLIGFSKSGNKESVARIVEELNRRWTKKENYQKEK